MIQRTKNCELDKSLVYGPIKDYYFLNYFLILQVSKVDSVQVVRVRASRISETFQSDGNEDPLAVRWVLASSWSSMATATSVPFAGTVRGGWDHQLRWGCYRGFPENGTFNEASVSRN